MKYAEPSFFSRALLGSPEKGNLNTSVLGSLGTFLLKLMFRLARLESHHQCGKTADNCQDAENKRQGKRSNKGIEE